MYEKLRAVLPHLPPKLEAQAEDAPAAAAPASASSAAGLGAGSEPPAKRAK